MKILVLTNLYPPDVIGGYELGCRQVVDALIDRGHDVKVLTTAPRTPAPQVPHIVRELRLSDIWNNYMFQHNKPVTSRLLEAESNLVSATNVHALTRAVDDFDPDVAYVWNVVGVGGLGLMATLQHLGVPWLWHLMDDVPVSLCRLAGRSVEPLLREVDRQLDGRYLACSRQLVDEIEAGGIRLRPNVEIVPNWIVGDRPAPRADHFEPGQTLKVMTAGQINRDKGIDHLIEAAARVRKLGFDDFAVDIYGNADDPFFAAFARHLGLDNHVRFMGSRPQAVLARLYEEYDVFAFPTWQREPFGFAMLEASLRGCVPLTSQQSGNAEWFVHGVHCLKAARHPDAFAESLAAIMDGTVDLGPISRRCAAVVGRDFHLDAIVPRIERALMSASGHRKPGRGTSSEAYRMALLAEKLTKVLISEAVSVG